MFNVEVIGTLYINYVNNDPERPFYSLNITQKKKDKEEYYYVNIFFNQGVQIPSNSTKIRVKGNGNLFKDKNTKVTRISISNADILELIEEQKTDVTENDLPNNLNTTSVDLFDDKSISVDEFAF